LRVALDQPEEPTVVGDIVNALVTLLEGAELHPPTQELLEQYRESRT